MPALISVALPGSGGDFFFLPLAFGGWTDFLTAASDRAVSISSFDRLGFRIRPARLNRAQWLSMASVRLGFLEFAIFSARARSRRSTSAESSSSGCSRIISVGLWLRGIIGGSSFGLGSMGARLEAGATDVGREVGAGVRGAGDVCRGVAIGVEETRPLPLPRVPPLAFPRPMPLPLPLPRVVVVDGV